MATVRRIVTEEDRQLHQPSVQVQRFGDTLHKLLDDMAATMYAADGVGIAAPQIGVNKCVVVLDDREGNFYELVNPRIVERSGAASAVEYCLSVPTRGGVVVRSTWVKVEAQDRNGEPFTVEATDMLARIFQHEIDHLHGVLFTDVMIEEIRDDAPAGKRRIIGRRKQR